MFFFWIAESPESNGVGRAAELNPPQPKTLYPVCCVFLALCAFVQLRHPTTFTFQQMVRTAGAIRLVGSSSGTSSARAGTEERMKAA